MGTYLPLGPAPLVSVDQINELAQALNKPQMAYLLMAWLRQNFEQATRPAAEDTVVRERTWLFLGVARIASRYVKALTRDEKRWFQTELDAMTRDVEQTITRLNPHATNDA